MTKSVFMETWVDLTSRVLMVALVLVVGGGCGLILFSAVYLASLFTPEWMYEEALAVLALFALKALAWGSGFGLLGAIMMLLYGPVVSRFHGKTGTGD